MIRSFRAGLLSSAIVLALGSVTAPLAVAPAYADSDPDFDYFHDQLAQYGDWFYSDRWGEVWQPVNVPDDWRPYTFGRWVNTAEYGWLWLADEPFGDITMHYGRWVFDPYDGWLWLPGYTWSPAWVIWHRSDDYVGWMPLPPDDRFYSGDYGSDTSMSITIGGLRLSFNDRPDSYYGYRRWYGSDFDDDHYRTLWHFVPLRHFADRDYRRYEPPRSQYNTIIFRSTNITSYAVVNHYIVNRSVRDDDVRRAGGQFGRPVRAADVVRRPNLIISVDRGHEIRQRGRDAPPRGFGMPNSAPAPTRAQAQTLSTRPPQGHPGAGSGGQPSHLLRRDDAAGFARPDGGQTKPVGPADLTRGKGPAVLPPPPPPPPPPPAGGVPQPPRSFAPVTPPATLPPPPPARRAPPATTDRGERPVRDFTPPAPPPPPPPPVVHDRVVPPRDVTRPVPPPPPPPPPPVFHDRVVPPRDVARPVPPPPPPPPAPKSEREMKPKSEDDKPKP